MPLVAVGVGRSPSGILDAHGAWLVAGGLILFVLFFFHSFLSWYRHRSPVFSDVLPEQACADYGRLRGCPRTEQPSMPSYIRDY
jgi:hypothetical protein